LLTSLASVLLLAVVSPACSDQTDEDETDVAIDDGNDRGRSLSGDADDELGEADEVDQMAMAAGILRTIDMGEVAIAQQALGLIDDPVSADFANKMITVHTAHVDQIDALAATYGFEPAEGDVTAALMREGQDAMKTLQTASDPAHVYINLQVGMHEEARVIVDGLEDHFDDGEFRDFLGTTLDTINEHRQEAIDILRGF
jgi:predicted outer membrane protein